MSTELAYQFNYSAISSTSLPVKCLSKKTASASGSGARGQTQASEG